MRNDEFASSGADRLVPLHDLKDFKVAKDDPDARGWKVIGADGERFGRVRDLIVDPEAMKARYLAVEVDGKLFNEDRDRHLLVPIGAATLDREDNKVFVPFIDRNSLSRYPVYQGGPITDEYEYSVRNALLGKDDNGMDDFDRGRSAGLSDEGSTTGTNTRRVSNDFYQHEHFNDDNFYGGPNQSTSGSVSPARAEDRDQTRDRDQTQSGDIFEDRNKEWRSVAGSSTAASSTSSSGQSRGSQNIEESISTLERLEQMRSRGTITEEEFTVLKRRALDL